jgi:vacuolar protein sorting-associated protein VTA1
MDKGIKMKLNSPEVNTFLITLMDSLELSKKSLQISSGTGASICENYALSVFDKADDEDRAGMANKLTAKTFYTASTFFDILEQFDELDPELVEKRKYSKWKAADILNAIKQGLQPTIGAPGEVFKKKTICQLLLTIYPDF